MLKQTAFEKHVEVACSYKRQSFSTETWCYVWARPHLSPVKVSTREALVDKDEILYKHFRLESIPRLHL
jgi:hypothetical protein